MTSYSWQAAFDRLEKQGPARIIQLFKIGLREMPRLENAFLNGGKDERQKARDEISALFQHIDSEMQKAIQNSGLSEEEFIQEIRKNSNFTQEERAQLSRVPELIGKYQHELFAKKAFNTPKKRGPYFKV